jgi:putative restriction endonuclease
MRYWWVNQKQTYRHEIGGSYLWSPKRNANGARNQFYENMKELAPGDLVFSYWESSIRACGYVASFCSDAAKPAEFGATGRYWDKIGYRAGVTYVQLDSPVSPRESWQRIRPLLPAKYSPLNAANGHGLQSVYLAALPAELGELLRDLVASRNNAALVRDARAVLVAATEEREREAWELHELEQLQTESLDETERRAIVKARRGQGVFRQNVAVIEQQCRITRVANPTYLIACQIKPWRHANNRERLSGDNGLMLAPQADFLFDRGFISFEEGRVLISPVAHEASLVKLGLDPDRPPEVGRFNRDQERFLEFHRRDIFRSASTPPR